MPRTDYFPLRDGNRWEYRLLDLPLLKRMEAGQAVDTAPLNADVAAAAGEEARPQPRADAAVASSDVFSDPDKAKPSGNATARRVALELRDAVDDLTYRSVYDTAEQVWSKKNGYIGFQSARGRNYLLILPPHSGYKWVVTAQTGRNLYYQIESAASSISTPAGTFDNCALARQESWDRKEVFRYWFAPDVGLVRRSKYFDNTEVFRQELVTYTVKPATPGTRLAEDREVRHAIEGKNRGNEFRDSAKDDRERHMDNFDALEQDRTNEKIRKYSEPR
ncbi:MAG TPA: hypothetical protein VGP72_18115 [Planctomycetota bacterium]